MQKSVTGRKLRFGANYIPSKNWLYSWLDWDRGSIREDLQAVASLGMDHVRAHLLWPYFQPGPQHVSEQALDRLEELLDICDTCGLDAEVTVLTGWISGFQFFPAWKNGSNMFTDAAVIDAQKHLFCTLAERIAQHPRFLGFDLGNELSVLHFCKDAASIVLCDAWMKDMMALCDSIAPSKLHVNGVDHNPWFSDKAFSRNALAASGTATSLHTWIFFSGAMDYYKPMDIGCTGLAEYCIELAHAYAQKHDRKVWIQEFGASHAWMPSEQIPDFTEQMIRRAATCKNLWGFTWWCSHDIDRRHKGFQELEYDLGLFTINNELKPVAERISQLIKECKAKPPQPIERPVALVFPDKLFSELDSAPGSPDKAGWIFAKPYLDCMRQGIRPSVVLESRMHDNEHVLERSIKSFARI